MLTHDVLGTSMETTCTPSPVTFPQVIMSLGLRKAELTEMLPIAAGKQRLTFVMPSRGMIGFKTVFVNITRGEGLMSRAFLRYDKHRGPMDLRGKGECGICVLPHTHDI